MYFLSEEVAKAQKFKGFEKVANKILKQQGKLGKLQGLTVNVKSLPESNLRRLVKNGAVVVIPIALSAIYLNKKLNNTHNKLIKEYDKDFNKRQKEYDDEIKKYKKEINDSREKIKLDKGDDGGYTKEKYQRKIGFAKDDIELNRGWKKDGIERRNKYHKYEKEKLKKQKLAQIGGTSGSLSLAALINFARKGNKQDLFIVAKYKYGTKMFKVYEITKHELSADVDKEILKSITETVSRMKKNTQFSIKEDVTLEEFREFQLIEDMLMDL